MKSAKFWLGLFLGMFLSTAISMGIFYYYVVSEIEALKAETQQEYKELKEYWNKNLEDEYNKVKDAAVESAKDKLMELQKHLWEEKNE